MGQRFLEDVDELFEEVARFCIASQKASASLIQRQFSIGYARAARLLDQLEQHNIVSAGEGAKPREVLLKKKPKVILPEEPEYHEWHRAPLSQINNLILKTFVGQKTENEQLEVILGMKKDLIVTRSLALLKNLLIIGPTNESRQDLLNSIVISLISTVSPEIVKLILMDVEGLGFTCFNGSPHLITPVIHDFEKPVNALKWALGEIESRYKLFREVGVRNIQFYNVLAGFQSMSRIVIIINTFDSPLNYSEIRHDLARIAQVGSQAGVHLVLAGNSDDKKTLPPEISNNLSNRIYFKSISLVQSDIFDIKIIDSLKSESEAFFIDLFNSPEVFRVTSFEEKDTSDLLTLIKFH